jgi:hypothetical protein
MHSQPLNPDKKILSKEALSRPDYLSTRADGLYITLSKFHSGTDFKVFIDEIFSSDFRFADLNYDIFQKLLYDDEWLTTMQAKNVDVKIASGIAVFPQNRRALYKSVKVLDRGKQAEYVFEPVYIETTIEEPVYGETDENGVAPIINNVGSKVLQPATLNIDEFIAVMWAKGIKYGILIDEVRKAIEERTVGLKTVALCLLPVEGKDADILEVCPDLHRDNSPKTLLNGKADMRAFKNRFPHIAKGARLLKKIPRVMGKHGYKVTGEVIEPAIPKDLNLLALASTGTTAVLESDGDYIVAQMDGFLNIDPMTNTISITEKIETTAGVSMRTTGDLNLNVEEFVEHGEVQEGRVVKGRHMTFKADVFGNLISTGGNITVDGNLTGGMADASNGNVNINRASRSTVHALKGEVTAKYCENCTVIAQIIRIEQAINCELIADEIYAENIAGCMLVGKSIKVASSSDSKSREALITMIIPDLSELDQSVFKINSKISAAKEEIASKQRDIEVLRTDPDFAKFMGLYDRIKSGEIKLTTDQTENWQKLVTKNAKAWNQLEALNKQILALERVRTESEEEIAKINQIRDTAGVGLTCTIDHISGHTSGQTMTSAYGLQDFVNMSSNNIKVTLQNVDHRKTKIFSTDEGSVNWSYK